ncbi:DDE superfamily endonuclease [Ceratobasidium sp. AG-Ba]|nr:DDE superfamily endonuclease [Ceratobasidium sp. AG-Ba]
MVRRTQLAQARNFINPPKRRKLNNGTAERFEVEWAERTGERKAMKSNDSHNQSVVPLQFNRAPPCVVHAPCTTLPVVPITTEDGRYNSRFIAATPEPERSTLLPVDLQCDTRIDKCAFVMPEQAHTPARPVHPHKPAPPRDDAADALNKLDQLLYPPRKTGAGYKLCRLDALTRKFCKAMATCLRFYVQLQLPFIHASNQAAIGAGWGIWAARRIQARVQHFVATGNLPKSKYGCSSHSMLEDKDFTNEINIFLMKKGKYVVAEDIVQFLADPKRWLRKMKYRWGKEPTGQYFDGHERTDVVEYRTKHYAPRMKALEPFFLRWDEQTGNDLLPDLPHGQRLVMIWFNDSSTFFANDRKPVGWFKINNKHLPLMKKGLGASATVYDFVSAECGFLKSRDGKSRARKIIFAGKGRDGYMTNSNICEHFEAAAKLAMQEYPDRIHVFVYDNARIHTKRPATAPSARFMPKGESKTFGANVVGSDGKLVKTRMMNPQIPDRSEQELYLPNGNFKGMTTLLKERGYNVSGLKAQCTDFKCPDPQANCCCRRILFRLIDQTGGQKSNLELLAEKMGTQVIFLPKFHCELNPIEQCWGRAKETYQKSPSSSLTADVERNMIKALDHISLKSIRKYFQRSRRFLDAYAHGLDGPNAAASEWARRKMSRHRASPEHIEV